MKGLWRTLEGSSRDDIIIPIIHTLVYSINNDKITARNAILLCKACTDNFRLVYGYELDELMRNLHIITFKCNQFIYEEEQRKHREIEEMRKKELKREQEKLQQNSFSEPIANAIIYENTFALTDDDDSELYDSDLDDKYTRKQCNPSCVPIKHCIIM